MKAQYHEYGARSIILLVPGWICGENEAEHQLEHSGYSPSTGTEVRSRGGGDNLFSGRGVRPGFLKCGACELTLLLEMGPL